MPIILQVCIVLATVSLVVAAVALVRLLGQLRHTAAQLERTMTTLDQAIPTIVRTVDEAHGVLDSLNDVLSRSARIVENVEQASGKAAKLSNIVVDQVLGPASQVAALVSGVRSGASFLLDGWRKRRSSPTLSTGGNHDE